MLHALLDLDFKVLKKEGTAHRPLRKEIDIGRSRSFIDQTDKGRTSFTADMGAGSSKVSSTWFNSMACESVASSRRFTAIPVITSDPASVTPAPIGRTICGIVCLLSRCPQERFTEEGLHPGRKKNSRKLSQSPHLKLFIQRGGSLTCSTPAQPRGILSVGSSIGRRRRGWPKASLN